QPARASALSSLLPTGAGTSISFPLGTAEQSAGRADVQVFDVVDDGALHAPGNAGDLSRRRIAFNPVATMGGMAGVAAWPSRLAPAKRPPGAATASTRDSHAAATMARRATASY